MTADTRWLEKRGQTWYAVLAVPRPMRPIVGRARLVQSLKTSDLRTAQRRRLPVLTAFQERIARVRSAGPEQGAALQSALAWRQTLQRLEQGDMAGSGFTTTLPTPPGSSPVDTALMVAYEALEQEAESIAAGNPPGDFSGLPHIAPKAPANTPDPALADTFRAVATGRGTPLLQHLESWLAEGGTRGPVTARTQLQYRSDIAGFVEWTKRVHVPGTVEAITKSVAGRYITQELVGKKVHPKTSNRKISALSAYWKWLTKRTDAELNPWQNQSLPKNTTRNRERPKRAFTDQELATLLNGDAGPELHDLIRVAALSGARIEELYRLRVGDCQDGIFRINRAKTEAGVRDVPIHSDLAGIVARRTAGKAPDQYLFHEAKEQRPGRERSVYASKRFGTYRQSLGVHERQEGSQQSRVSFHSLRHWFTTQCERAGIPLTTIQSVIGHAREGVTFSVYSEGPSLEQKRRCVESVKLPMEAGTTTL